MQQLGEIITIHGLVQKAETGMCELHGPWQGSAIWMNKTCVCKAKCPACLRVEQEEAAKAQKAQEERELIERNRAVLLKRLNATEIPSDFRTKTFETFKAGTDNERTALDLSKRFVKGWDKAKEGGFGLLFFGGPGTGKSHLACSIILSIMDKATCLYATVPSIIRNIRATWGGKSEISEEQVVSSLCSIDLLVIDEIGVQLGTDSEKQILFSIIDSRLSNNKPTIFITNLPPNVLIDAIGPRLVDRIKGKCVPHKFTGESHRKVLTADVFGD